MRTQWNDMARICCVTNKLQDQTELLAQEGERTQGRSKGRPLLVTMRPVANLATKRYKLLETTTISHIDLGQEKAPPPPRWRVLLLFGNHSDNVAFHRQAIDMPMQDDVVVVGKREHTQ